MRCYLLKHSKFLHIYLLLSYINNQQDFLKSGKFSRNSFEPTKLKAYLCQLNVHIDACLKVEICWKVVNGFNRSSWFTHHHIISIVSITLIRLSV